MSKPLPQQIVAKAREIIADPRHWIQGSLALSKNGREAEPHDSAAYRFCAVGALMRAASTLTCEGPLLAEVLAQSVQGELERFAGIPPHDNLEGVNDRHKGHAAIMKIFDDFLSSGDLIQTQSR